MKRLLSLLLGLLLCPIMLFSQVAPGKGNAATPLPPLLSALQGLPITGPGYPYWSGTVWSWQTSTFTLPVATSSILGGVKPDGTTISNTAGAISVNTASLSIGGNAATATNASQLGGVAAASYAQLAGPTFTGTVTIPYTAPNTSTQATTQNEFNNRKVYVYDYLTSAQKADVLAGTETTDCTAAVIAAMADTTTAGKTLVFTPGTYKFTGSAAAIRTVSGIVSFDVGALLDASTCTAAQILYAKGSQQTNGYVNTNAMTQGAKTITLSSNVLASVLNMNGGETLQISTNPSYGGSGALWYGGRPGYYQGEIVNTEAVFTAQLTGTVASNVLTLTANNSIGVITVGDTLFGNGIVSGVTVTGLTGGTANTTGATYSLSASTSAVTTGNLYTHNSTSNVVALRQTLRDTYAASAAWVARLSVVSTVFENPQILMSNNKSQAQAGIAIYYGKDCAVRGGCVTNSTEAGILAYYVDGLTVDQFRTDSTYYTGLGEGYGFIAASCQKVSLNNSRLMAGRTGFSTGGAEPCRDVLLSNSFFDSDSLTADRCIDTHGNTENLTITGCTLYNSAIISGKCTRIIGCTIYIPNLAFQYATDFQGGSQYGYTSGAYFDVINNHFIVPSTNGAGTAALMFNACGTIDHFLFSGNDVQNSSNCIDMTFQASQSQPLTITDCKLDNNQFFNGNSTGHCFYFYSPVALTNTYITKNKVYLNAGAFAYWASGATATRIDYLDNEVYNIGTNCYTIQNTASGAGIIRCNRNLFNNTVHAYYPPAITAATSIEFVGNQMLNSAQGAWTLVAPNILLADNTTSGITGTTTTTGRVYNKIINTPAGAMNVETNSTAAPTTGTWIVGDICKNSGVTATSVPGWVCTTGGTPGTWTPLPQTGSPTFTSTLTVSGTGTPASLSNLKINSYDTVNGFLQNNIQNLSSGTSASSDWIATADTGTDSANYVDLGINGSGYSVGAWTINGALDGYLYSQSTNLAAGTATAGKNLVLFTGGTLAANARLTLSDTAATFGASTPLVLTAGTGGTTAGEHWYDSTQLSPAFYANGVKQTLTGTLFTQTGTGTNGANTTITNILGSGVGTAVLPASYSLIGKTIRVRVVGTVTTAATPGTTIISLYLNAGSPITVVASPSLTLTASMTSMPFDLNFLMTFRTTTTVIGGGHFTVSSSTTGITGLDVPIATTTAATIVAATSYTINVSATNGTASGTVYTSQIASVEVLN